MVKESVKKYLREGTKRGFSHDVLKKKLLESGFSTHDVNEALWEIENAANPIKPETEKTPPTSQVPTAPKPEETKPIKNTKKTEEIKEQTSGPGNIQKPETKISETNTKITDIDKVTSQQGSSLHFFSKVGLSIIHPTQLFERIKGEKMYPSMMHYLLLMILPLIILITIGITYAGEIIAQFTAFIQGLSPELSDITLFEMGPWAAGILIAITVFCLLLVIGPTLLFITSGITHLLVKLYKGKKGYAATFRTLVYASTPLMLLFWLPIIPYAGIYLFIALILWIAVIAVFGTAVSHETTIIRASFIVLTTLIILTGITIGILFLIM